MLIPRTNFDLCSPERRRWVLYAMWLSVFIANTNLYSANPVDFDHEIAPLLASKCLKCHGAAGPEGGLSLTSRDSAYKPLESGHAAVVPRQPQASELLRRVSAIDGERMPPTGPALTAEEIALLRRWIEEGADWPEHWAYRPLHRPNIPATASPSGHTPIDQFLAYTRQQHGLPVSSEADRRTLYRRLSVDLHGLLPLPDDVNAFVADTSPNAYEQLVDRLLSDPRYGERQSRHWMDLVHFAETHGHDQDRPRENAWPYRDYLIRAFNEDLPYRQFVEQQVAGDVIEPENPWALVATGFLAAGPWDESSLRDIREDTIDRQIARYLDRDDIITTVMSTFSSTTAHCARCHDHKFDPISQEDYYALQAVFAATDKGQRVYDPLPQIGKQRALLEQQLASLPQRVAQRDPELLDASLTERVQSWAAGLQSSAKRWQPLDIQAAVARQGSMLTRKDDGSYLASGTRPATETYDITATPPLTSITGWQLEVLSDPDLPKSGPGRQDNGNLHLNEVAVHLIDPAQPEAPRKLDITAAEADFNQEAWTISHAIDGNPQSAWGIYPKVGESHRAVFRFRDRVALPAGAQLRFELQQLHGGSHLIGRWRIHVTDEATPQLTAEERLPAAVQAAVIKPPSERTEDDRRLLAAAYLEEQHKADLAKLPPKQRVYTGSNHFEPDGGFRPSPQPRLIHILKRGNVTEPLAPAAPGTLAMLAGLPSRFDVALTDDGPRRAALARWLTDPANGLTWRSIVNRVWQQHFGRGLVDTPNDFGRLGSAPSHPELLDWFACELRDRQLGLKSLHRMIVTSAAYRQQSQHQPDAAAVDADNRYLWRMTRTRLDAESLRDSLLRLSDSLDDRMGGPSVRQFVQTPGIHVTPNVDYAAFDVDSPAFTRRSIYRFLFRTIPDPFMDAMDCPDSSQLTPKRSESLTALQALALLNDKLLVRQSSRLAERVRTEWEQPEDQVKVVCRQLLLRNPREDEQALLVNYLHQHGLDNLVRVLMNSNEFVFVD